MSISNKKFQFISSKILDLNLEIIYVTYEMNFF